MTMHKFSIITPSYNSWKYMSNYWKSLEQQTYKDFEVIIVDDCSQDETFARLNEYKSNSNLQIKLLQNTENHGPGYTRNRGIREAEGEWITFVDSDDSVDVRLLEKAAAIIQTNDRAAVPVNCIVYDYNVVNNGSVSRASSVYGNRHGGILPTRESIAMVRNHVIGKLYKAERIKNIAFPELKRCEDVAFVCRAIDACCVEDNTEIGCLYYLKEALYYYEQRSTSLSNDKSLDSTDMTKAYQIINDTLGDRYHREIGIKAIPDLLYGGVLMMCKADRDAEAIKRYINEFEEKYPSWYNESIVKQLGKAKRVFLTCIRYRRVTALKLLAGIHSRMIR